MTPSIRILTPALLAAFAVSCSPRADQYDTPPPTQAANPNGDVAAPGQPAASPAADASNPVYDTPAAYEESSSVTPGNPGVPAEPTPTAAAPAKIPSNGAAIIHTVGKGDTLSGISAKYKISVASIKQANRMTNDTVVLGRKMVIPPQ
ncbi:MAG: LysM peptidoglycan-binding domain-containing protein [Verrucomicrobiota bacterium]